MFAPFYPLPDYRLDILDTRSLNVISTGYFTAKQEEQIGDIIRGLDPALMTFKLYGIIHDLDDKTEFGTWLAQNTTLPIDPGI